MARERRRAEETSGDEEEYEVWKPPTPMFGGLIGSHAFSGPSPVASYRTRKQEKRQMRGVRPRWTADDIEDPRKHRFV